MSKYVIPEIEVEISDNLSLVIRNVNYYEGDKGKYFGLPEDCYPATGPEVDWNDEDTRLMYKERRKVFSFEKSKVIRTTVEHYYPCPKGLDENYIDDVIDACEDYLSR